MLQLTVFLCLIVLIGACSRPEERAEQPEPAPTPSECYNPYYPVTATARREYRITYEDTKLDPSTFVESFSDISRDSFTMRYEFPGGLTVTNGWRCTGEGLSAQEYVRGDSSHARFSFETKSTSGVTFPAAEQWAVGKKWRNSYEVEGRISGTHGSQIGGGKGTIVIACEIVGEESVSVPAGTFNAMKVRSTITQKMTMTMQGAGGMHVPVESTIDTHNWYVRDVGMVKSQTEGLAGVELVSFSK